MSRAELEALEKAVSVTEKALKRLPVIETDESEDLATEDQLEPADRTRTGQQPETQT